MAGQSRAGAGDDDDGSSESTLRANTIFGGLSSDDLAKLTKDAKVIDLDVRDSVYAAEERISEISFPIDSVLSIVTEMREGGTIEVGTIGREGCSAIPLLMGATTTANDCYCQVPGRAIKISVERFHSLRDRVPAFRALLDRYLQGYVNFLGQLAGCNPLAHRLRALEPVVAPDARPRRSR
jgi:hypothetical protein